MFRGMFRQLFSIGNLSNADCRRGWVDPRFFRVLLKSPFYCQKIFFVVICMFINFLDIFCGPMP